MKIVEVRHPLVQHKLGLMRRTDNSTKTFRDLASEVATLLTYEATSDLETEEATVEGWAGPVKVQRIKGAKVTLVPILRAGLGMLPGVLELIPAAKVGVVGLQRDEETLQPVGYYEKLTGREFLYFVAEMYNIPNGRRDEVLAGLVRRLDIGDFIDHLTESYSHGMRQKVVLAAAMLHEPSVLVIDEPMVGLDPRTVRAVRNLFVEHTRSGGTVFMSTHTLDIAEALADRIGIIHRGELIAIGTLADLRAKAQREHSLEEIFLQLTEAADA